MKKRTLIVAALALAAAPLLAQAEKPPSSFGISFSGFIKTDVLLDSRQTVSLREGHFLLYPKEVLADRQGSDINARASFQILSIQTRLVGKITGPDALGAATSGLIEGEFFGTADGDMNGFRLRHAYIRLDWKKSGLLIGQWWHPMFITDCFPDTVSFNTGAPFQPFSRAPQIRLTRNFGGLSVAATALAQRDFASNGPEGTSSAYIRNAAIPEFNLKLQYGVKDGKSGSETVIGLAMDHLRIAPRLVTTAGYKTKETLGSSAVMAYFKRTMPRWTFKAEGVYGQNLHHLTMLGGYGVTRISDPVLGTSEYAPLETLSVWGEIQTNGRAWQAGLFGGYARNLGAGKTLTGPVYGRGTNIRDLYRLSPRIVFNSGKLRLAAETEWTSAAFGTPDARGKVGDARRISNLRLLLATYYFF